MIGHYARTLIWDLSIELVFECFHLSHSFPLAHNNQVGLRLKEASAAAVTHVRHGLERLENPEPWFKTAAWFLQEIQQQLQVAHFLGFIGQDGFQQLTDLLETVRRLMI